MAFPNATVTPSGATWAQFTTEGFGGLLQALIAANTNPTANPTVAPTLTASGTTATLPAATYWAQVTETNAFGETLPIAAVASQAVTAGEELTITFQALEPGNTARNVYLSTTSATAGFALAATGVTAGTYNFTAPLPANSYAVPPPTFNSTGLAYPGPNGVEVNKSMELLRRIKDDDGRALFRYISDLFRDFLRGDPMPFNAVVAHLGYARGVVAILLELLNEAGTLIDANAGTLGSSPIVGNLYPAPRRTWP